MFVFGDCFISLTKAVIMRIAFLTLIISVSFSCFAQPGYEIRFTIDGLKDTTVYLGTYYGENTYVKDTATSDDAGEFAFFGNTVLPQGVYFLALNGEPKSSSKTRVLEFVVSKDQHFSMETSTTDYIRGMKVTGDLDNKLYFENMFFISARNQEAEPYRQAMNNSVLSEHQKKEARERLMKIGEKVVVYHDRVIKEHPTTLTSRILKANQPIKIPEPPKQADGSIDSTFQFRWYREHFFDNFDLADEALLRLSRPMYRDKVNEYLDKLFVPQADTLKNALEKVIAKAKNNPETYKYAVLSAVGKYQSSEIMGLDDVFIHLNDKYFVSGEMDFWANEQMRKNMNDHANQLRKSLIGQKGDNLIMLDGNNKPQALYDIKSKYTILYIFDPDCGTCKKETPKLVDFYNTKKWDVEVYAVCADSSMTKMRDYIKEMDMKFITVNGPRSYVGSYGELYDANSTPTLYVLDDKKMIIAKKIPAEKLDVFLTQYARIEKLRAAGKL